MRFIVLSAMCLCYINGKLRLTVWGKRIKEPPTTEEQKKKMQRESETHEPKILFYENIDVMFSLQPLLDCFVDKLPMQKKNVVFFASFPLHLSRMGASYIEAFVLDVKV